MRQLRSWSRRDFVRLAAQATPVLLAGKAFARGTGPCQATDPMELGPYHRDGTLRTTLLRRAEEPGRPLTVSGVVRGEDTCSTLRDAIVDVWQADASGNYDFQDSPPPSTPAAYRMRGVIPTDARGHYHFESVVPGNYADRARHIHYLVTRDGYEPLITQAYFEGDPRNGTDPLVRPSLIMPVTGPEGHPASVRFDITLRRLRALTEGMRHDFQDFVGKYVDAKRGDVVEILWRDGSLMARFSANDLAHLQYREGNRFLASEWAATLTFARDDQGHISTLIGDLSNGMRATLDRAP